jgi:glycosyltransferase involved in cell wall biosynthesis
MPQNQPSLTVVIPCRQPVDAAVTLRSLERQTFRDFEIITVVDVDGRGAPWARNTGFSQVKTEFVLFSDDDIDWEPDALETLLATLRAHPEASYAYGSYAMGDWIQCNREWNAGALRSGNYIPTMSLIRSVDFPGFDENIKRLQDWDLWLTMFEQGKTGVYCGKLTFRTKRRDGITYGKNISWEEAVRAVRKKHFQI